MGIGKDGEGKRTTIEDSKYFGQIMRNIQIWNLTADFTGRDKRKAGSWKTKNFVAKKSTHMF